MPSNSSELAQDVGCAGVQTWIPTFLDIGALDAQLDEAKIALGEVTRQVRKADICGLRVARKTTPALALTAATTVKAWLARLAERARGRDVKSLDARGRA